MAAPQNINHTIKNTKILECTCVHEYQDKKHGKGKRVHNPMKSGYKCTVCGKTTAKE